MNPNETGVIVGFVLLLLYAVALTTIFTAFGLLA